MQSVVSHLVLLAIVIHLALGCCWHHGMGQTDCSGRCNQVNAMSQTCELRHACHSHPHDSAAHLEHAHNFGCKGTSDENYETAQADEVLGLVPGEPCHQHCCDDGCHFFLTPPFMWKFDNPQVFGWNPLDSLALVAQQNATPIPIEHLPADTGGSVRAHLLFSVQLL